MDEHDPRFEIDELLKPIDWQSFFMAIGRAVIFGLAAAGIATFLGCSTIDPNNRVEGWPQLEIVAKKVSFDEVQERCRQFVGWGQWPMACASFLFHVGKCHVYYAFDWALDHEVSHCQGLDHPGSNDMRAMLKDWKSRAH